MGEVIKALNANWSVIVQAPWAFAIWTVVVGGVVWAAINHLKQNSIENLEGRLKLRDDEINDYKRKLSGATPEEAKARIDSLEARLNLLMPRSVSAKQRETIREALASETGIAQIGTDGACADAPAFGSSLSAAFKSAGWTVINPFFMGLSNPPLSGLGLRVADPSALSRKENLVVSIFRNVGLSVDVQPRYELGNIGDMRPTPDIEIVITPRVLD